MVIMPQTTQPPEATTPEHRRAAAVDMLLAHKAAKGRLRAAERSLVVAAVRAGLSARRVASILGCSRGPVDAIVAAAKASGDLSPDVGE